ncbi:hypothetical protein [Fundicoccus culcitae]|uniref:Uncharacterized protein n=1 Tax=Fundicoccus culcitae TaxID=2969821 RepID=A0ABY5P460_9LACT|nr:hypothetical protein [Fundicoccus culcitae]UUX33275.1 hypothetical protein NRE15_10210 [Fundicoccus culcitae]
MSSGEKFKAIVKEHEMYHDLVDTDVDEENGEKVDTMIFQLVEVVEGHHEYDEAEDMIHVSMERLEELYDEPINDSARYLAVLSNEYIEEIGMYDLHLYSLEEI